jgi:hypothetical protein
MPRPTGNLGLQAKVLHPDAVEYAFLRFEEQILRSIDRQSAETAGSRRQLRVVEAKIRNCTEAIASMGWSTFLRAQLQDLESQHRELADKLAALEPCVVKSTFRDARRFVEARLKNL